MRFGRFPFRRFAVLALRSFCDVSRFPFCRFSQSAVFRFKGHARLYSNITYDIIYYKLVISFHFNLKVHVETLGSGATGPGAEPDRSTQKACLRRYYYYYYY